MTSIKPILSVIIPCYNHGQYILEALQSVETYPDKSKIEIIIINDGSNDNYTIEVLNSLEKKGYFVLNQENQGLANARNNAINIAKGKYILPLDADNRIRPCFIEKGISILDKNEKIGIVYGDALYFQDENYIFKAGQFSLRRLLVRNFIDACVVMRKEVWQLAKGYDPEISPLSDWDLNLSAAGSGWGFYYIPEIIFEYRVRKDSMVRTYENPLEIINYISKKHGTLYRSEFLKTIKIKGLIKILLKDLFNKFLGKKIY